MKNHSQEPWKCIGQSNGTIGLIYNDGKTWGNIATTYNDIGIVDAQRIVLCVNACIGIPNEKLEEIFEASQLMRDQVNSAVVEALESAREP